MATSVLKNCKLYTGGYDLSGDLNKLTLSYGCAPVEYPTFGYGTVRRLCGLLEASYNFEGYSQLGDGLSDVVADAAIGTADDVVTVCPTTGAAGQPGYTMKALGLNLERGGAVGEMFAFTADGSVSGSRLMRGTIMANGALTATGNGTARQLGAVATGSRLYAAMHVIAVAGTNPTLDMVVQSDIAENFADATARITFAQATAIGAQFATPVAGPLVDGAEADDWWRLNYTIGGTDNPSFTVIVNVGIMTDL